MEDLIKECHCFYRFESCSTEVTKHLQSGVTTIECKKVDFPVHRMEIDEGFKERPLAVIPKVTFPVQSLRIGT